jgi:signal peptidase II
VQAAGGASLISAPAEREAIHRAGSLQWAGLGAVAAAAIVADQLTKQAVEERVPLLQSNEVLPFVAITHVRNTGIAFGIFPGNLGLVSVLTAAAVVWMLVHFARSGARHVLFPAALGLLVGGSLSNLADRIRNGWVTDFIDISRWPTFNLADTFIVAGVALLLLGLARVERHARAEPLEELEQ